jgi:hypothetical protein
VVLCFITLSLDVYIFSVAYLKALI